MSSIIVNRSGFIVEGWRVAGCLKGGTVHYSTEGMGTLGASAIGSVERVECAGPRGGDRVEWRSYGNDGRDMGAHDTRTEAVATIVRAWGTEADVETVESVECLADALENTGAAHCADGVTFRPYSVTVLRDDVDGVPERGDMHTVHAVSAGHALESYLGANVGALRVVHDGMRDESRAIDRDGVEWLWADALTGDALELLHTEYDDAGECVVCGSVTDYCPGHGYPERNHAEYVWAAHDAGYHGACRASCREEGQRGVLIVSREYDPDTDVHDGEVDYAETRADWNPDASVLDVADLMEAEHLTTSADAHGPDVWTEGAARGEDVNYRTGTVTETEGYLRGYTDAERAVIAALVTREGWECGGVTVTGVAFRVWDVDADEVDADTVPWFHREDYPDVDADDAARFIPLTDGDVLPLGEVLALRESFAPGAAVMEPDNVHRVLHGASTDSAWSGYGVIHDYGDDTWSVVRMAW